MIDRISNLFKNPYSRVEQELAEAILVGMMTLTRGKFLDNKDHDIYFVDECYERYNDPRSSKARRAYLASLIRDSSISKSENKVSTNLIANEKYFINKLLAALKEIINLEHYIELSEPDKKTIIQLLAEKLVNKSKQYETIFLLPEDGCDGVTPESNAWGRGGVAHYSFKTKGVSFSFLYQGFIAPHRVSRYECTEVHLPYGLVENKINLEAYLRMALIDDHPTLLILKDAEHQALMRAEDEERHSDAVHRSITNDML